MSADLIVYLPRTKLPSSSQWAEAIRQAGFPLEFDTFDFDMDRFSGFRPCRFQGEPSGFEYFARPLQDNDRLELGLPIGLDFSVNLVVQSGGREWETAAVAAGVLCQMSGGVLSDPQEGKDFPTDDVLGWIKRQVDEVDPWATQPVFVEELKSLRP